MTPVYDITTRQPATAPDHATRLATMEAEIAALKGAHAGITAPVRMPAQQDMEVHLMPSTILDRLEEYRGDESLWLWIAGLFAGAAVGILTSVVTGGHLGASAVVILVVFILMAFLTGGFALRARLRGNAVKRTVLRTP